MVILLGIFCMKGIPDPEGKRNLSYVTRLVCSGN